jgi:MoaA/NifB/PqqE/SkfB family radical SAM enzyme
LADKINKWLETYKEKRIKVHIGSDGDPFASHIYQYLIANTPLREGITYSILTNGLLLDEFYSRLPTFFDKVYRLGVSIDGASRDTYEKLRLGGRWERICENLDLLSKLRREKNFEFCLHMVVQQDNWREMAGMLDMGYRLGADVVYFNKIQDWGTGIDFSKQTFVNDNEFKKM